MREGGATEKREEGKKCGCLLFVLGTARVLSRLGSLSFSRPLWVSLRVISGGRGRERERERGFCFLF